MLWNIDQEGGKFNGAKGHALTVKEEFLEKGLIEICSKVRLSCAK